MTSSSGGVHTHKCLYSGGVYTHVQTFLQVLTKAVGSFIAISTFFWAKFARFHFVIWKTETPQVLNTTFSFSLCPFK